MRLGLHLSDFTWPQGPSSLRTQLGNVAAAADQAGIDRISVMDHVWQIGHIGPPEHEMLEAYTTLGYLAARTERASLMTLVTGVTYRDPGLLAKIVTTLDVLTGGRAWLGIGAAWNEEESKGLGLFFPPLAERYERLEETLQICLQMWSEVDAPYNGQHYRLGRTLNSPQSLSRPHPPILIGGSGEKKTLRLVARYAQACNLWNDDRLERRLDVLRAHCEREGRDYDEIQKTVSYRFDLGEGGTRVPEILDDLERLANLGIEVAHGAFARVWEPRTMEIAAEQLVPAASKL